MMKDRSGCKRLSTTIAKDDGSFSLVRLEMLGERQFWPVAGEGSKASGKGSTQAQISFRSQVPSKKGGVNKGL